MRRASPFTKTWRYMHSQFPETLLYKDCRMGLLEVNTGFRFNIDFKTEEREPVKEIMTKLPPNDKLCVNMNYRQSWGSFSQDKMVSWDITVNVAGLEEAYNEAEVFWGNFQHMTPLVGYMNMFNIDQVRTIFLDVTNSEALRILSRQGYIAWVLIVAPKMQASP